MKISYNWLREMVETRLTPRDLATRLTMAGLAVDAVEAVGDDHVLEFDLTSNRPDCLSHLGVAREVAALEGIGLVRPSTNLAAVATKTIELTAVEVLSPELCPRYTARLIRGVRIGPSPEWLVRRLEALGQRSVNNVADITNYVMLETGQPLHAFDFHQLRGRRIVVRRAHVGEQMTTLDGELRDLTPEMLVIADAERAVAIGGIKGGEDSGISAETVDVLLEAASFVPGQIRQTSRALGLATEASYRFERGVDPLGVLDAADRACTLIVAIAGGEVLDVAIDVFPGEAALRAAENPIPFRAERYRALTGLSVDIGEASRILGMLGCRVLPGADGESLSAVAPTWRIDIRIEEDLIEEVARIAGYDLLQTTLPGSAGAGAYLAGEEDRRAIRRLLTNAGYHEAVSFSFVNVGLDALFSTVDESQRMLLLDPIDETQSHMRTTLLGGLFRALEHNFNHGSRNVRLFEIGKCFIGHEGEDGRPREVERLAIAATGARHELDWQNSSARLDFFDLKGVVESLNEALGLPPFGFRSIGVDSHHPALYPGRLYPGWLHPGRAAEILLGGRPVGQLGQLHPHIAGQGRMKQAVLLAEIDLAALLNSTRPESRYHPLPKFPAVVRDQAFLIETSVSCDSIISAVRDLNLPNLVDVRLFDIYAGRELPAGSHSLALTFIYRADDRTLTDEEVSAAQERIVACLRNAFNAELR